MKRITTILMLLMLVCMGAGATVSFDNAKRYFILEASTRRPAAIGVAGADGFVGLQPAGTAGTPFTFTEVSTGVFTISNADNAAQKLGANHVWNTTNTATEWTISEAEDIEGTYLLHSAKGYLNYQTAHSASLYVDGSSATDTDGKKVHFYIVEKEDYAPSIPSGKVLSVGTKVNSFTVSSSASDNDHWYFITQNRLNGESGDRGNDTPIHNTGTGSVIKRAANSVTPESLDGANAKLHASYLVRFINVGTGLYNIQFADGDYIYAPPGTPGNIALTSTADKSQAYAFAFYNTVENGTTFGWNVGTSTGKIVDNNGSGNNVAYWGTGTVTATSGNNVWSIYPVTFTDASIDYNFTTTDGAFFREMTTNMAAGNGNYCNLWLSKVEVGKPQVKLISNDALSNSKSGNNMRSSGGLFTTTSSHQYNLHVSEGKIKSYTIVGTAVGALSITPEGGDAEAFAAAAAVNKKVTLDSPAKSTNFTLSGSSQWLNVSKFIIEWESDATTITNAAEISNDGIYMITSYAAERGVLYATTNNYLEACGGHANTNYPGNPNVAIDADDINQQFALYTYNGKKYLYNIGQSRFVGKLDGQYYKMTTTPTTSWTIANASRDGSFYLNSTEDSKHMTITAWTTGAPASPYTWAVVSTSANEDSDNMLLTQVGTLTSSQQNDIEDIISKYLTFMDNVDKLESHTIGSGIGEYTNEYIADDATKNTYVSGFRSAAEGYSASNLTENNNTVTTAISAMVLNSVPTNTFLRLRSSQGANACLKAADAGSRMTVSTTEDKETIFLFASDSKLISYSKGLAVNNTREMGTVGGAANTFSMVSAVSGNIGQYSIKTTEGNYLYSTGVNDSYVDRNTLYSSFYQQNSWILEAVDALPITFKGEYASFYSPVDLKIPDNANLKVYTGTMNGNKSYLLLSEITTGTLPANTGVILHLDGWTEETSINFPILSTVASGGEGDLRGTIAAASVSANSTLVLGKVKVEEEDVWGIYKYSGTTLGGFKAYMDLTDVTGGEAKGLRFIFEDSETTGVNEVIGKMSEATDGAVYDLQGRKVANPSRGLYIINGHKVVIK